MPALALACVCAHLRRVDAALAASTAGHRWSRRCDGAASNGQCSLPPAGSRLHSSVHVQLHRGLMLSGSETTLSACPFKPVSNTCRGARNVPLGMARVASHTPHRPPVQQPALVDAEQCCLLPLKPLLTSNDVSELTVYEQTKQRGASMTQLEWTVHVTKRSVPAVYQPSKSDYLGWVQFVLQVRSGHSLA